MFSLRTFEKKQNLRNKKKCDQNAVALFFALK